MRASCCRAASRSRARGAADRPALPGKIPAASMASAGSSRRWWPSRPASSARSSQPVIWASAWCRREAARARAPTTSQAAGGWPSPASEPVSQFRPRIASGAVRASSSVSSLVTWLRSMTCRKSSTVVLLACSPLLLPEGGRITVAAVGSGEGVLVNRLRSFPVVLLAGEGDVVDAGGAGGVVAAAGVFRPGLGVGVPGDVMRGRGPGVLPVAPDEQHGQVEWVEDQLHAPAGQRRAGLVLVPVQGHQGRLGHGPPFGPAERLTQVPARGGP